MNEIKELLSEARHFIDGHMNCHTPEYTALDRLERAVSLLAEKVQELAPEVR